jgi:hypothetical protein
MTVKDELRDPWSYVVAGLTGGLAGAVMTTLAPFAPVALGVGAAVFGVKVLSGAFFRSGPRRPRFRDRRLPVLTRTTEAAWLARAEQAQVAFDSIADTAHDGPIAERVRSFGDQTAESLASLQRIAGQASAIRTAMVRLDPKRLEWERDRILGLREQSDDATLLAERQRSLEAVQSQLDSYERLRGTLAMLLARLESGTLGIEGLVARLAEVVALSETTTTGADGTTQVDELARELEGLRAGLVETEAVSTRAMQGLAPLPSPAPGSVPQDAPQERVRRRAGE